MFNAKCKFIYGVFENVNGIRNDYIMCSLKHEPLSTCENCPVITGNCKAKKLRKFIKEINKSGSTRTN